MPFLTVYTPTFRRPLMLAQCETSVQIQTAPVEHVIVQDEIGLGIDGMYGDIRNHLEKVSGEYVMVLSDDNVLVSEYFAGELEREVAAQSRPAVVVFKGLIGSTVQPASWGGEPRITQIDLSCFAVQREIWQAHAADWGERYEGDFDFIHALWRAGHTFHWWDRVVFRALQISHGEPEQAAA